MSESTASDPAIDAASPSAKGALRNSASIFVAQALGGVLGFVSTIVTLQVLTRPEYGIIVGAIALIDPIRTLASLGIDAVGIKRASIDRTQMARITGSLLALRMSLAAIAVIIAAVVSFVFRAHTSGGSWPVLAASLVILPAALTGTFQVPFQATQSMRRLVAVPLVVSVVQLSATLLAGFMHAPLAFFALIPALGELANALVTRTMLSKVVGDPLRTDWKLAFSMLRDGSSLAYMSVVVVLYTRGGYYVLENIGADGAVADLGAANALVTPLLLLGTALFMSFTTYGSFLASTGRYKELRESFASFVRRVLLILIPVALVAALAIPLVIEIWKPQYRGASLAFRYLAFGAVWMLLCQVSSACLIALDRPRVIALMATMNFFVFFAIAIPLGPRLYAEGVAIATFVMELVNAVAQVTIVFMLLRRLERPG